MCDTHLHCFMIHPTKYLHVILLGISYQLLYECNKQKHCILILGFLLPIVLFAHLFSLSNTLIARETYETMLARLCCCFFFAN